MSDRRIGELALAGIGAALAVRAVARAWRTYDLRGKIVLITGGSRGLGLEMAREFAACGARLALCARDEGELDRARRELIERGADVITRRCDVTDRGQVEALVSAVEDRMGRLDVLVNNAGVIQVGPLEEQTLDDFEQAMAVHFWAPLYATLAALPGMKRRREGRIVNIASIGGKISVPHLAPYCASKFALVGLSNGLRSELAQHGIAVTTVCPGLMRTGSHRHAYFKGRNRTEYTLFSILAALPVASINSASAARQVVHACRRGDPEVVLGPQAQAAAAIHALLPGLTADVLAAVDRLLPGPGGIGTAKATGTESMTPLSRSLLTWPLEQAARANNELS